MRSSGPVVAYYIIPSDLFDKNPGNTAFSDFYDSLII